MNCHASALKHTHTICYHNDVETKGRRGQGVAIFIHNIIVLRGSLGCEKSLNFTRQSGFTSMD